MKRESTGNRSNRPRTSPQSGSRPKSPNRRNLSEGERPYKKNSNSKEERFDKRPYKRSESEAGKTPYSKRNTEGKTFERKPGKTTFGKSSNRKTFGSNSENEEFKGKRQGGAYGKSSNRKTFGSNSENEEFKGKRPAGAYKKESSRRTYSGDSPHKSSDRVKRNSTPERDKKGYGRSDSYGERKSLKSIKEGRPQPDSSTHKDRIGRNDEFPQRSSRKRTEFTTNTPGKGKFTKKSELKGFKPKFGKEESAEDFRFRKPGSRGKKIDLERKEEFVSASKSQAKERATETALKTGESIRLNRYISNAGVCSRREADDLIKAGLVSINSEVVTELGTKVKAGDVVRFNGEKLSVEAKVYIILNKPKDAITTADDPEGRNTVMDIFEGQLKERIFPIGRLDRNTTGVLLLTNDGELATRLMHPKYEIRKVYKATLDKNLKPVDLWSLSNGVELEDGFIKPDAIATADAKNKNVVGIEIHSGKNRIIHRMFEHLGYSVDKLDRVLYAGLEKGTLKRGAWRELNEKELKNLKKSVHLK